MINNRSWPNGKYRPNVKSVPTTLLLYCEVFYKAPSQNACTHNILYKFSHYLEKDQVVEVDLVLQMLTFS